ncbi:glycosyltransferase family 2 protein [Beijerinckia mobilis]|uniref:glycosyltransferase family 2 protein n=1 Tax=Beijerinckia mobilis TaxID=231434 RepID=UPI00147005CB|nr:glycosyltransferase family A protein [Beijerinckia mobilis]
MTEAILPAKPMFDRTTASSAVPTLSIVIPAYNVANYIRPAVESALAQTFTDLEVIVVDDGSTDTTPAILADLVHTSRGGLLRIIRQENRGLSGARNTGIQQARGAFIGFLDGDDIWLPEKAAKQIDLMKKDPSIGISFSHSEYLTENGRRTGTILFSPKAQPSLHDLIRRNHLGNGSTVIARRECFEQVGLFRTELRSCEDYEMWCRILCLTTYKAVLTPEVLTLYRLRQSSLTFNAKKFIENADLAIAFLRKEMPNVPKAVIDTGHVEHYRIAASRAALSGHDKDAWQIFILAMRIRPISLLTDWKALATAASILIPSSMRSWLADKARAVQSLKYKPSNPAGNPG